MTKAEKDELKDIIREIEVSDDRIDILERLYHRLKIILNGN